MDPLTSAAASGMRARIESLDMLANNIANASAPGFKADREFYNLYLSAEAAAPPEGTNPSVLPVIERQWTDFSQGTLTPTGNPLDVALSGKGFFVAKSPSGPLFTRGGSFKLSPQGELQTPEGYRVQAQNGKPILLNSSKPFEITPDGTIRQDGQELAQLSVVDFQDPAALSKRGDNYFQSDTTVMPPMAVKQLQIQQGKLEASNSQPAESAVRLINVMRQFESLQKALNIGAEMNRRAVDEVAKVT
jgi:flagellar basal-body rod protein FlgF